MPDENGDPLNMREAIEMRQESGAPGWGTEDHQVDPEPTPEPVATGDEFADVVPEPGTETEVPAESGAPVTEPVVTDDPFLAYGGKQVVEDAVTIAQGLRTETGVRAIVAQGLNALGYSADQVKAFFEAQGQTPPAPDAPAGPLDGIADDDVITAADARKMIEQAVNATAERVLGESAKGQNALAEQLQNDRARVAQETVDSTLTQLLDIKDGKPDESQLEQIALIQRAAGAYLSADDWNPQNVRNALIRGKADVDTMIERQTQAYIARKRAARASQPANIAGGTAGGEEVKEPQNLKEARARAKAEGFFD